MPTEKPRVTITVTPEQLQEIENFRYDKKMKNQTQAILSLIRVGLDELTNKPYSYEGSMSSTGVLPTEETMRAISDSRRAVEDRTDQMKLDIINLIRENWYSEEDLKYIKKIVRAIQKDS